MSNLFNYQIQSVGGCFTQIDTSKKIKNTKKRNIMQIIKNLLTALLIGFVTIANANNNPFKSPTVRFTETANEKIRLTLINSANTALRIQNAEGITIYNENIVSENTVAKDYDLTTLADGTYVFSIELSDKIIEQAVIVEKGNVTLENAEILSKPVFFESDQALFVTIEGLSNEAVEVRILDNNGTEIYQDEKQNIARFNTKYDLSKLANDNYIIVVNIDGKSYYKYMELN